MDFSSPSRALLSLERRRPALPEEILAISKPMITAWNKLSNTATTNHTEQALTTDAKQYLEGIHVLLSKDDLRWEALAVGLYCGTSLLELQTPSTTSTTTTGNTTTNQKPKEENNVVYMEGPRVPTAHPNPTVTTIPDTKIDLASQNNNVAVLTPAETMTLASTLHKTSMLHLEHKEPRIRTLVAKAVGAHASLLVAWKIAEEHAEHYHLLKQQCTELHNRVISSIEEHMQQGQLPPEPEPSEEEENAEDDSSATSSTKAVVLDDTTGWRALETNWQCLACLIQPLGHTYFELFPIRNTPLLQQCQSSAVEHVNRHARAAAMLVLEQWIRAAVESPKDDPVHEALCQTTTSVLKDGLADNWSQVRMAASVLCRAFFTKYFPEHPPSNPKPIYATLIPRCCLNRFYLAQGMYNKIMYYMIYVVLL